MPDMPLDLGYRAPPWLPGGNLQTLYPALIAPRPRLHYQRERWDTADGDFIDLDWTPLQDRGTDISPDRQPLLVLTSDDGLKPMIDPVVAAARAAGGTVSEGHEATDHSWSDARLALERRIYAWLQALPARR